MSEKIVKKHALGLFSLVMITVGSVDSIRNLPATALFGSQLFFFFAFAAICFLIPCALVSAELASRFPKQGGIYIWVKEALGDRMGFLAIWFQWIENVMWYPTILSFVAGTMGYLINPALIHHKGFLIGVILSCFWGATLVNLRGMHASARFSNICAISGLLVPMALIIGLGGAWLMSGAPVQINFQGGLLPHFNEPNMWVALTGVILSFCGIEIATVHAGDVADPRRDFPKALLYSVLIIISTLLLGSLAIAIVLPSNDISLVAGIMQAFDAFFAAYHMRWVLPVIAGMLILGSLGGVSNWIIAPTKGILVAAKEGQLPAIFATENAQGAPQALLVVQAVIVSLLSLVFLIMPSENGPYWLLTVLAAQLYMLMYLLMFISAIRLRFRKDAPPALFEVPGGRVGLVFVAGLGLFGTVVTLVVGFIPPPESIPVGSVFRYELLLASGLGLMCIAPFILRGLRPTRPDDSAEALVV